MSRLLKMLARATDTKGYPDDKDPAHWRTIHHAKVHLDASGHVDGGAGKKFDGAEWTSTKHPHRPETYEKPKGAEDLKKAWAAVAKERMEVRRARTEASRKRHEEKLEKAYKEYTDMRAEIEARDPAEAAKFKPRTASSAASPKKTGLGELAEATTPEPRFYAKTFADGGIKAVGYYAAFKKSGKAEDLEKAQKALESATGDMKFIADPKEEIAARALIIAECKKLGLECYRLRDLFKEIKKAVVPGPVTGASSPLGEMAVSTDPKGVGLSGASRETISATRRKLATLSKYEAHREKSEAKEYASKGFTKIEREEFEMHLRRIFDSSSYGMVIKTDILSLVMDGKFKSQYETGTSMGASGPGALRGRARIFGTLLGTKKEKPSDFPVEIREKYGALVSSDTSTIDTTAEWYGKYATEGCLIRFKKERLAGRVTYTWGDSLDYYDYKLESSMAAGDADFPSLAGFSGGCAAKKGKSSLLSVARKAKDVTELRTGLGMMRRGDQYIELQYHGDLGIDDIESVQFKDVPPDAALVKKCKAKGVKCIDSRGREL